CLGLSLEDLNLSAGYVVCTGKGGKQRLVPVGAEAMEWTRRYLREVRPLHTRRRDSGRLFVNPRGGPLSRQSLWTLVRRAATAAGLGAGAVVAAPPSLGATDALRLARRRGVDVVAAGGGDFVLREDLARAEGLGVGDLPLRRLARPLPALAAGAGEIAVRRAL